MTTILALSALLAQANGACATPALSIRTVTSRVADDTNDVNHYLLHVVVLNAGAMRQASNVLQSVSVMQDGQKVGEKGIPPLPPGGSYAFDQPFQRSDDARAGSTTFVFRLHADANVSPSCYGAGSRYRLRV